MALSQNKEILTIRPGEWTPETEAMIAQALTDTASLGDIKAQAGGKLFCIHQGERIACAFVLRVDHMQGRSEGVVVAAGGAADGVDLTAACLPIIESMFVNCSTVRIHTARPGLVKKLGKIGYRTTEIVLTKGL